MDNLAIEDRSSVLLAALTLVSGVLPPFTEPVGVDVDVVASAPAASAAFFFAAFSASLFCFEAEGGMVVVGKKERYGV